MATPEETTAALASWQVLRGQYEELLAASTGWTSTASANAIYELKTTGVAIYKAGPEGSIWALFMAGSYSYQRLGDFYKYLARALNSARAAVGVPLIEWGRFWSEVVAQTGQDAGAMAVNVADKVTTAAPYVVVAVVVILVLILAVKVA